MAGRRLSVEESALWARVAASVRPFRDAATPAPVRADPVEPLPGPLLKKDSPSTGSGRTGPAKRVAVQSADTLDGGWDRRLRRGLVAPDRSIDLHGHTLASAHDALDHALARAIDDDVRLLLVVTGRPPRPDGEGRRRGLIRAAMGDWLAASPHAARIAAVRNAHPRHGGAGALYLVLRRRRG